MTGSDQCIIIDQCVYMHVMSRSSISSCIHPYYQCVLAYYSEPPQYPEPYRKEGEYGFLSESGRADESPSVPVSGGSTRMRSKSINVHALMDESEDPLEILEAYFSSTVMNLTDKGMGTTPTVSSPFHRSPTSSGCNTPSKQQQQQQQVQESPVGTADGVHGSGGGGGTGTQLSGADQV
jgi:hypothetical protein